MLGGKLLTNNCLVIEPKDTLIAAYSHMLYFYSYHQTTLLNKLAHHKQPIVALHSHINNRIHSLDSDGLQCVYELKANCEVDTVQIGKKKTGKGQIKESRYVSDENDELYLICLHKNGNLIKYEGKYEYFLTKQAQKILLVTDSYVIVSKIQTKQAEVISLVDHKVLYTYEHTYAISSAQIHQNNLIIADQKGKIHILACFFQKGKVQLRQKLQWHTQEIKALQIEGSYLYSAGQEGVVVMWHLRQNKRDFLPRIGCQISNITVSQSKICCFLADNSIKLIDLNNDKSILHYKTIVNPHNHQINSLSQQRISNNLLKGSQRGDKIWMRASAGKIQELNLFNGVNIEHNILNRNMISRLDNHLPIPHQITNICFSSDEKYLAVSIEGVSYRVLKFYEYNGEELKLISKVENCHKGISSIQLIKLNNNRFLSFSSSDKNIKIWKNQTRSKESILEIEQEYWCCEYEINCRELLPKDVTLNKNKLFILYPSCFIIFNLTSKTIENVYNIENNESQALALYQITQNNGHKFMIFYEKSIEILSSFNNCINEVETIVKFSSLKRQNIAYSEKYNKFAVLESGEGKDNVYIKSFEKDRSAVSHYEIPHTGGQIIKDLFWIDERLVAVDDNLLFYNITHDKQLLKLSKKQAVNSKEAQTMQEEVSNEETSYSSLFQRHLQRQSRKDKSIMDKYSEILSMAPSITASFQLLANQLFI